MSVGIVDELKVAHSRDEAARQGFLSALRRYTLNHGAAHMKAAWEGEVAPAFAREHGRPAQTEAEIHGALKHHPLFAFYSVMRTQIQRSVWRSVMPGVARSTHDLKARAAELSRAHNRAQGTLHLDADFKVPAYSGAIDVHQLPGSYAAEYIEDDITQGAIFEEGVAIVSMGFFGPKMHDIGESMAVYVKSRWPDFRPKKILDLGCTIGHSTVPWKEAFPDAEVHGIDLAAPILRYAHARSQAMGVTVHYHQKDAVEADFPDGEFDLIFSSMLLHEIPDELRTKLFRNIRRMLKPGGLMWHYELPPDSLKSPYENFYLNWDSYYNVEPFYKSLRGGDYKSLSESAGFAADNFLQTTVPSRNLYGDEAIRKAAAQSGPSEAQGAVGQLISGVRWFGFGAWKEEATSPLRGGA